MSHIDSMRQRQASIRFKGVCISLSLLGILLLSGILASGCAHFAGKQVQQGALPEGAPEAAAILKDLAANDARVSSFRANGAFTLESPQFQEAKKYFKESSITYRRPADLSVIGKKLGSTAFRLTCVGEEFLIEFPATRDAPYYRLSGEKYRNVPFSVSPSLVAREMMFPEPWADLPLREVRVTAYDAATQKAMLEIGSKRAVRRRVEVKGIPWVIVRDERLNPDGTVIALCTREDYCEVDGALFPKKIDIQFHTEQTRMTFDMRQITVNPKIDDGVFDIKTRAREAGVDLTAGNPS